MQGPSGPSPGTVPQYRESPTPQYSPSPVRGMMAQDAASAHAMAAMGAASPSAQQPGMGGPPDATWRHMQMHDSPDGKLTRYDQKPNTLGRSPLAGFSQRNVSSM